MYVYYQQLYNTGKAYTTQGSVYREKQQQQNFAGLRVELQAAPCLPCSKLGVKRGHCATIPLSLSIAAVEAEYVYQQLLRPARPLWRLLCCCYFYTAFSCCILLMRSSSEAMAFISLFISSKKKGVYMMMILMRPPRPFFGLLRLCFSYPRQPDSIISKVGLVLGFSAHSVGCSSLNLFFVVST